MSSSIARDHQIRPRLTCNDGCSVSIQASSSHYSTPREDHPDWHWARFECVEVGFPENSAGEHMDMPEEWAAFADYPPDGSTSKVYAWVPVQMVAEWLAAHGGTVSEECPKPEPLSPEEEHEALMEQLMDHVQSLGFFWVFDDEGRIAFTYADLVNRELGNPPCLWAPQPSEYRTAEEWLTMSRREIRDLV